MGLPGVTAGALNHPQTNLADFYRKTGQANCRRLVAGLFSLAAPGRQCYKEFMALPDSPHLAGLTLKGPPFGPKDEVRPGDEEVCRMQGAVVERLSDFRQVLVRTEDGEIYPITTRTPGVPFDSLRPGQRLTCFVTRAWPRIVKTELAG